MPCALDLSGLIATAKAGAKVTIKLIAQISTIQRVSLNGNDITDQLQGNSLTFTVPAGRNTIIMVLLPPPASEEMKIVEDCGGGNTQTILSLDGGIHAAISFDIIGS